MTQIKALIARLLSRIRDNENILIKYFVANYPTAYKTIINGDKTAFANRVNECVSSIRASFKEVTNMQALVEKNKESAKFAACAEATIAYILSFTKLKK